MVSILYALHSAWVGASCAPMNRGSQFSTRYCKSNNPTVFMFWPEMVISVVQTREPLTIHLQAHMHAHCIITPDHQTC